jgi:hypothetical protein
MILSFSGLIVSYKIETSPSRVMNEEGVDTVKIQQGAFQAVLALAGEQEKCCHGDSAR